MKRGMALIGLAMLFRFADAQVVSNFPVDADGWTASDFSNTAPQTVVYSATGGNPGGYISMTTANPQPMYWFTPSKFMGNRAYTSYGENLTFSILTQAVTPGHGPSGDIILSNGNTSIYFTALITASATNTWTNISVKLDETAGWKAGSVSGATASRQNIIDVLTNLTTIRIYVAWKDFPSSNTLGAIDNVTLNVHPAAAAAPLISSVSPLKAAQGSNVTITGTNFGSNSTNNAVFFGKRKAAIVSASSTSIVVTVPVGADYGPVTVTNLSTNFSDASPQMFIPTFASGGGAKIIKNSFTPDVIFTRPVGYLSHGDLNGDGRPEMLASSGAFISIFENVSTPGTINTGSFATRIDMSPSLPDSYSEINTADLDGDGKYDVFMAFRDNPDQGRIGVLRNVHTSGPITSGSFAVPQEFTVPPYTASAAAASDLDGDGRPELISWGSSCGTMPIYILQNLSTVGDINFAAAISLLGSNTCSGRFLFADLDGDGKTDIIQTTGNNTRIIRNTSVPGTLSFDAGYELGDGGNTASVGDVDNDGKPDIVFASGGMKIYKNVATPGSLGLSSFQGPVTFAGGINTAKLCDINGDGKPDVVTGTSQGIGVYENIAVDGQITTGSFKPFVAVKTTAAASEIDVFDIDLDGRADIISNNTNGNISVNQNIISVPPTVTNINPKSAAPGSTITITGTNFSSLGSDNIIYFGAAKGVVTNASPTSLEVTVPAGASYDQVSVALRGYTVFSPQFFTPTFSGGSTFNASSFASSSDLTIALAGDGVTAMDYDGDGKVDILSDNNNGFSVYRTIGNTGVIDATTFATPYSVGFGASHLRGGDLDGDGKPDLISLSYITRNASNSSLPNPIAFETQVTRDNGSGVRIGAPRDLNNDGKIEVFYTNSAANIYFTENQTNSSSGFIQQGVSNSSFSSASNVARLSGDGFCVSADFDGDGFNDIATTNTNTNNMTVFLNAGLTGTLSSASFSPRGPFATGDTPQGIAALDFDGDGKIDIAVANGVNSNLASVMIFRNTSTVGNISFTSQAFPAAAGATDLVAADMDGDGKTDLVTINTGTGVNSFSIFRNTSATGVLNTTSFAAKVDYATGSSPRGLAVADIDRDNRPEVIVTRANTIISVFKNLVPLGPSISFTKQPVNTLGCENANASFIVIASGANNLGYQWQIFNTTTSGFDNVNGATSSTLNLNSITPSMNGNIYRVLVTGDLASSKTSDQVILTVSSSPSPPVTTGATSCKGSSLTLTAGGSIDGNYRWYDSPGSQPINNEVNSSFTTPVVFNTTTFYAAIVNTDGCTSSRVAAIATIAPLTKPVINSNGTLLCGVNVVTINGPSGFSQYHWSNGEATQNIDVSFVGSYSLIVEDANSCLSLASDPIVVSAGSVAKPIVNSSKPRLCTAGDEVILTAPENFASYEWSNGATTQTINVTEAGEYNVRVTNESGCRSETSDDVKVESGAEKPVISIGIDVLVSTPAKTYQWYYGDFEIPEGTQQFLKFNPFQYGAYTVSVTDLSDCSATSDVFVNLVTGMEGSEQAENGLVFPNPFVDKLVVVEEGSLFDSTGKKIMNLIKGENDVSQLSRGLYLVIIKNKTIKVSK